MTVLIEQTSYPVTITLKKMKRIILRFREGSFFVSAPLRTSQTWIHNQVQTHGPTLILKHRPIPKAVTQEGGYMLGRWYAASKLTDLLGLSPKTSPLSLSWIKAAHAWFLPQLIARVHAWQKTLSITQPYRVRLRSMRSRLGSNSRKTITLTFATKLMHVAWPMIDAVIVHELIHDRHFDHSSNFYKALNDAYPDYEQEHAKLLSGQYQ